MDVESLASLESQTHFCQELKDMVLKQECFVLLAGESGSGRTVACEHVVNETDSKLRAVFIPCRQDMQLHKLREMFLNQLLPHTTVDYNLNLADALSTVQIPHNDKILVVVDDIDNVIVSFYNELLALYEQFLGQARFAFVLVCHPMWAEEKLRSYMGKAHLTQMQIPALNNQEALALSRHLFASQNMLRIYDAISNKLPAALAPAKGNLSQIILTTEKLMKEPTAAMSKGTDMSQNSNAPAPAVKKKKTSSASIFVSVVCIVIVLACLIPILMGGDFFSSSTSDTTAVKSANDDALVFNENQYELDDGYLPSKVPTGLDAPTHDSGTEHSVTLSGEELDKIEGGAQSSAYPRGMDRPVNQNVPATTGNLAANQATNANNSAVASALALTQNEMVEKVPVLKRERNLNHAPTVPSFVGGSNAASTPNNLASTAQTRPVAPPDISEAVKQANAKDAEAERAKLEAAAKAKLEADRKLAQAAKQAEEQAQKQEQQKLQAQKQQEAKQQETKQQAATRPAQPSRPPLRAGQIINLAEEQRQLEAQRQQQQRQNQTAARQPQPYVPSGNAFEGQLSDLSRIANNHYTVQIVSASNRANISAAAQGLNGKYWILETRRNGRPWYVLCAGDYASRNEAMQAAANIPRSVSQGASPFAKSIGDLKSEFRL